MENAHQAPGLVRVIMYAMLRAHLGRITLVAVMMATFCITLFFMAAWSINEALYYKPQWHTEAVDETTVSAKAFLIIDVQSGEVIASKDPDTVFPIASITKLLSAAMFYKDVDLEATTTITWADLNTEGDAGHLSYGDEYTYRELLFPLLLESSNDAASALLRLRPDLLEKMNAYVESLGLSHTRFADTSGLSDKNVSTAHELSVLMRALYEHDPYLIDITSLEQYVGTHTGWANNNPLINEAGYEGGKHGYTFAANRTDAAFFNQKLESGQERLLLFVVLGSEHIPQDVAALRTFVEGKVRLE